MESKKKGYFFAAAFKGKLFTGNGGCRFERLKRGSEKKIKKTSKSFGRLEKTITFAAAKTKTSSLKLLGKEEKRKPGRVDGKVSKDW